jgi:hypothetical protein
MYKWLVFLILFSVGEILFNLLWFPYLKTKFVDSVSDKEPTKIGFLNLSTFKGIFERFIISLGLIMGFPTILIVFGTIKLGTRFKDEIEIKNDYFLIGNFSSILIALGYSYFLGSLCLWFSCD